MVTARHIMNVASCVVRMEVGWLNIRFLVFSIHLRCSPGMFFLFNTALHFIH